MEKQEWKNENNGKTFFQVFVKWIIDSSLVGFVSSAVPGDVNCLFLFVFDTEDGGAAKESVNEEVRETAAERRQRRMKEKLEKAKLRKKALFDSEYDAAGNSADGNTFFDEWKSEMEIQAKVRSICEYFRYLLV